MRKFKIGDRIRLIEPHQEDNNRLLDYGNTGTIMDDSFVPYVNWDKTDLRNEIVECICAYQIELIN